MDNASFDGKPYPGNLCYHLEVPIYEVVKGFGGVHTPREIKNIALTKFVGVINVGERKKSDFENYKKFKPHIKPCKRKEIVKDLNTKATRVQKYDAIQLLLNIAGSDEKLSIKEDQLLNKTARALNLDIEQFQKMKNAAIANIENIEHLEQINESLEYEDPGGGSGRVSSAWMPGRCPDL